MLKNRAETDRRAQALPGMGIVVRIARLSLAAACLAAAAAVPNGAAADTLQLRNGDRLTGTLVRFAGGMLDFRTDYAGSLKVPAEDIATVTTDGLVTVRFTSGAYFSGRLSGAYAGVVGITAPGGAVAGPYSFSSVAEIHPGTEMLRGFRWSGRVNIGATQRSGNADTKRLHVDVDTVGQSEKDRIKMRGSFNRAIDRGSRTEDDFRALLQHDHFVEKKVYFYTNMKFERDTLKDLRLRTTLGTGIGYQFLRGDTTNLAFEAGPAYTNEDFEDGGDRDYVTGRWAVDFDHYLWRRKAQLFHRHEGTVDLEDTANLFIDSSTGIRFPIADRFNATLQVDVDWDRQPAPERGSTDITYLVTLGYQW